MDEGAGRKEKNGRPNHNNEQLIHRLRTGATQMVRLVFIRIAVFLKQEHVEILNGLMEIVVSLPDSKSDTIIN